MRRNSRILWGALWRSYNRLNGHTTHLLNHDYLPVLFRTRKEARDYIEGEYGYIKTRIDLRAEPHGWKMPIAVRVKVAALRDNTAGAAIANGTNE